MIRRFAYHAFWNFYDYLGTLCLFGTLYALAFFGILVMSVQLGPQIGTGPAFIILIVGEIILTLPMIFALMPYCARAAKGDPARWFQLLPAVRKHWLIVTKVLLVWASVMAVITVSFIFYGRLQKQMDTGPLQTALLAVNSVVGWAGVLLQIFLPVWLAAATASEEGSSGVKGASGRQSWLWLSHRPSGFWSTSRY